MVDAKLQLFFKVLSQSWFHHWHTRVDFFHDVDCCVLCFTFLSLLVDEMIGKLFLRQHFTVVGVTGTSLAFLASTSGLKKTFCSDKSVVVHDKPVIYQYQICPFCHRVKAYLDFLKIDYKIIEVNPLTKSEISFSPDLKKVPIAIMDGQTIHDSSNIIEHISSKLLKEANDKIDLKSFFSDAPQWNEWSEL